MKYSQLRQYLQQPVQIRGVQFKNRMMVGPMSLGSFNESKSFTKIQKFYRKLCQNQVSSITMGGFSPDQVGRYRSNDESFFDVSSDRFIQLNEMLRSYGVISICQLLHIGNFAVHESPVSASKKRAPLTGLKVYELSADDIHSLVKCFANASRESSAVGFSGVELNAAEGFLLGEFISSDMNQRSDDWGGSPSNNFRILKDIIAAIRAVTPEEFLISLRVGADSFISGDSDINEISHHINTLDVDFVTPIFGQINDAVSKNISLVPEGFFLEFYQRLRFYIHKPLVANQKVSRLETLQYISPKHFDFVAMARPLLADPTIMQKFIDEQSHEVNQCLGCNQLCINRTFQYDKESSSISCLVNPFLNFNFTKIRVKDLSKVAVIGGGILGLQAAYALAQSGYTVKLFEKSKKLGGVFADLSQVPTKVLYAQTIQFYESQIRQLGVEIVLNQGASLEGLESYQIIFNATNTSGRKGFKASTPILTYKDVLKDPKRIKQKVVIIGGGGVGLELAEFCHIQTDTILRQLYTLFFKNPFASVRLPDHKLIYILEQKRGLLGHGLSPSVAKEKRHLLGLLGVHLLDSVSDIDVHPDQVTYSRNSQKFDIVDVDTIIDCTGMTGHSLAREILEDHRTVDLYRNDLPGHRGLEKSQEILIQSLLKIGAICHASEVS